jgi:hypothetical protein
MCTAGRNGVRDGVMRNRLLAAGGVRAGRGMRWVCAGLVAIQSPFAGPCRGHAEAETLVQPSASAAMSRYRIVRDDGSSDAIAGQVFDSYDAAYVVLERYYDDLCCSDDR